MSAWNRRVSTNSPGETTMPGVAGATSSTSATSEVEEDGKLELVGVGVDDLGRLLRPARLAEARCRGMDGAAADRLDAQGPAPEDEARGSAPPGRRREEEGQLKLMACSLAARHPSHRPIPSRNSSGSRG